MCLQVIQNVGKLIVKTDWAIRQLLKHAQQSAKNRYLFELVYDINTIYLKNGKDFLTYLAKVCSTMEHH